jgi:HSP20 family protein
MAETKEVQTTPDEGLERTRERRVYLPRADIFETENEVTLVADMPGVDESSLEITIENNVLKIVGRTQDVSFEGYTLRYAELEPGDFERSFVLGTRVDADRISASIKNGQLRLSVPKIAPAQKQIRVTAG